MADSLIAIIGAGLSGICMGVQLKRQLNCEDFMIFEKSSDVGGTWSQNTYPHLSCDVPSEFYSYSFFQNPEWSEKFASQPEILAYIKNCVKHFEITSAIRLQQECLNISWHSDTRLWHLQMRDNNSEKTYLWKSRYVITAMGVFNIPKGLQDLPILKDFEGQVIHTSQWRDLDFHSKSVVVIGNGCSANQVIPWILENAAPTKLTQIVRSEQWVAPKGNFKHSKLFRSVLRYVPFAMALYRLWTAWQLDASFISFRRTATGDKAREATGQAIASYMKSVAAPQYFDILIPKYGFGMKRPVMDHGYLETTNKPNFELIKCDGLQAVDQDGRTLVDALGGHHFTDIVILANGFQTQDLLAPMTIRGESNKDLKKVWREKGGAEAYMGVSVSGFPNLFFLGGPNTLPSANSTLHGIECTVVYITRLLRKLQQKKTLDTATIEAREDSERSFNEYVQDEISKLIYSKAVSTWYIDKDTGKNTLVWPGTQISFWWSRCVKAVAWKDWLVR